MAKKKETATETGAKNWFYKGEEGLQKKKKNDAVAALRKEKGVPRFFMQADTKAKIVFVDDEGFYCYVHTIFNSDSKTSVYIPCSKDIAPCPVCERGHRPIFTAHYTVIDTRSYTDKNGNEVKFRKVLYPAKGATINLIADLKEKYKSLIGRAFEVKRFGSDSPNCGSHIDYIGKVDMIKLFGKDAIKPFDYEKVLALPTPEELEALGFTSGVDFPIDFDSTSKKLNTEDSILSEL